MTEDQYNFIDDDIVVIKDEKTAIGCFIVSALAIVTIVVLTISLINLVVS